MSTNAQNPARGRAVIVKPDWGIVGGAELVIDRVAALLADDGFIVEVCRLPVKEATRTPWQVAVPPQVWAALPDYFGHLALVEAFERLDLRDADLVVSTQPPSYAVDHPRHLSLFYHHLRKFYDLSEVYVKAGYVDPELHAEASAAIRQVDDRHLGRVNWFLAGSPRVAQRLEEFNHVDRVSTFHAAAASAAPLGEVDPHTGSGPVLCVSRSEFTKRTELFVHAMAYLPDRAAVLVGSGGRLGWVRVLNQALHRAGTDLDSFSSEDLWCNHAELEALPDAPSGLLGSGLQLPGYVADQELRRLFERASCVVAPALDEDYGLTAIEAMAWGLPAIVCRDGGNLTELVTDGVNGLVVEPTGRAIAEAVERVCSDAELAAHLSRGARDRARSFTWERARAELRAGVQRVFDRAAP